MVKKIKTIGFLTLMGIFLCVTVFAAQSEPVTLKADVIVYDSATGITTAEGNVVIIRQDGEARSQRAEYNLNTRVGWLEGNVVATQGETKLVADKVWIRDENHITAEGSAHVSKAGDSIFAPRIDYWSDRSFAKTAGGWAKLAQADGSVMTANYIEYDMKIGEGVAVGNVELDVPSKNVTGAGDRATYTADKPGVPGEFVLTGNAWVLQDGNKIMGNKLVVKSDKSTSEARGDVRLDIQPKDNTAEKKAVEVEAETELPEESVLRKNRP